MPGDEVGALVRVVRMLGKPTSEVQGYAIGVGILALLLGVIGLAALLLGRLSVQVAGLLLAGVTCVAAVSACVALRKLRYERPYGTYFSMSVAVASENITDAAGRRIITAGVDEVCEPHAVRNLDRMAELNRQGLPGRLELIATTLEEMRDAISHMGDPFYDRVTYIVARSDLTPILFKMGFSEIPDPPRFDVFNRLEKRFLMWRIGRLTGHHHDGNADDYRMAVMTKAEYTGEAFGTALDKQIARARRDVERIRTSRAGSTGR